MKLRNKKTGEITDWSYIVFKDISPNSKMERCFASISQLNEEWEDAPSSVWYITHDGSIHSANIGNSWAREKNIGNYFETREEAEKALEKLKAWKRLRDKGLHVTTFYVEDGSLVIRAKTHNSSGAENWEDLDLLFEGEEE